LAQSLTLPSSLSESCAVHNFVFKRLPVLGLILIVGALPGAALAQSSVTELATITYEAPSGSQSGYTEASIDVRYTFMSCAGELWINYEVLPETMQTGIGYMYEGVVYPVTANRTPGFNTVRFAGSIFSSARPGRFADPYAIARSGAGCLGQTLAIKDGDQVLRVPGQTPSQREDWLEGVSFQWTPPSSATGVGS
jgi:hypothetical protein